MDTRYLIARLREQRGLLKDRHIPGPKWRNQTSEVVEAVLSQNPELRTEHGPLWDGEQADKATYLAALDRLIRTLNRTDEVQLHRSPVFLFTLAGILFMILLAGGSYLYFKLVIAR